MNPTLMCIWLLVWCCVGPSCVFGVTYAMCPSILGSRYRAGAKAELDKQCPNIARQNKAAGCIASLACTAMLVWAVAASPDLFGKKQ